MIKVHLTKGLSLRCHSKIGLETIGIENRDKGMYSVQWRAGFRGILGDVTSASGKNSVDGCYTVCRRLDFDVIHRLQKPRRCLSEGRGSNLSDTVGDVGQHEQDTNQEETRVTNSTGGWNDLTTATVYWLLSQ